MATRRFLHRLPAFNLERYFAKYEFSAPYLLCCSDTEALSLQEALGEYADDECRELFQDLSLHYTESKGYPPLLKELSAEMYDGADVQELVPQEGILLGALSMVEAEGDKVVVTSPGYQSLSDVAKSAGANVVKWTPTEHADGSISFSVDRLRELMRDGAKALVVNFPHNPTGCLPTREEWTEIVSICETHGTWLFSDEMYRYLEPDPEKQRLTPAVCAYDRGVTLSGVSKSMGMPGVRIGWLASRDDEFMKKVATLRDWTTICSSAPSQVLALAAVRARDCLVDRANGIIATGREAVDRALKKRPELFAWGEHGPNASPCAFARINVPGVSSAAYCEALAEHSGILLLPSSVYADAGDSRVRIGIGRLNTPEVVERWEATLDDPNHPATRLLLKA